MSDSTNGSGSAARAEQLAALGALAARVVHDVRNPLFAMSATLDAYEARFTSTPDTARYVAALREQLDRLEMLMKELVEYALPPIPRLEPLEPYALAEQAARAAQAAGRVPVRNHVGRDLPLVPADRGQALIALRGVLENAIRRSTAGSPVEIEGRCEPEDGRTFLRLEIHDAGAPVVEADASRLFDPLFTGPGGAGLELAIARRIVEGHRGDVTITSDEGRGARVVLRLPYGDAS